MEPIDWLSVKLMTIALWLGVFFPDTVTGWITWAAGLSTFAYNAYRAYHIYERRKRNKRNE